MPVVKMRAARSGANLMIFSGRVNADELLEQFGAIDETQEESSNHWLILDLGFADISELTIDVLSRLKAILGPKMTVMKARRPFDVAIVCLRPFNDPIYLAWKTFVGDDENYPSDPLFFSDMESACRRLGYEGPEYEELRDLCAAVH